MTAPTFTPAQLAVWADVAACLEAARESEGSA